MISLEDDLIIVDSQPATRSTRSNGRNNTQPTPATPPVPKPGQTIPNQPQIVYTPQGLPIVLPQPGQHTVITPTQATQLLQMQHQQQVGTLLLQVRVEWCNQD